MPGIWDVVAYPSDEPVLRVHRGSAGIGFFFFSSRRRHTRSLCDWSSDVCSSDLAQSQVSQDPQRHLARSRGPQTADGSRRAARHRRRVGRRGRRADAADVGRGAADPRDRARRTPPVDGDAGRARRGHDVSLDFKSRTVIVTGGAHGFGRAISIAFASRGAAVWACDVLEDELTETRALCGKACTTAVVDVRDKQAVERFVAEAGDVHILVNNAGGVLGQVGRPLEEVTPSDWQAIYDVNVTGAFYCSQAVTPGMKAARFGRIINISSGAGLGVSLTGIQAYASAKAAQIGLTRQLAHELGPWGITVNTVAPGFVRSNPTTEKQWESYGAERQRALIDGIALKRLGTPEDIAAGVLFFASESAGWISGQVLAIDGGK